MFRQLSTVAIVVMVAVGNLAMSGCGNQTKPPKQNATTNDAGSNAQTLPREIVVELGNGVKLELILISPGEFLMGSPDPEMPHKDWPQHRVRITKPFYLGKYPVTQEQWQAVMGATFEADHVSAIGPRNPMEGVHRDRWEQFLKKLNASFTRPEGRFALPTEAQWEYACRAGTTTRFYFGDDVSKVGDYAWYDGNSGKQSHPVGQKKPNAWGLYDMSSNVSELCEDDFISYKELPVDDPVAPFNDAYSVSRGADCGCAATYCRSTFRGMVGGTMGGSGLRLALVPTNK